MATCVAISVLISGSWQSDPSKGDIFEIELAQEPVRGEIVPVSPAVKNRGIRDAIAFAKIEMPTYGSVSPAYTSNLNNS